MLAILAVIFTGIYRLNDTISSNFNDFFMKAMTAEKYGSPDVLQLREVEKPVPKDNEVLIKVFATSVTTGDARIRGLNVPAGFGLMVRLMFGFRKPRNPVLGIDFAGEVESVGRTAEQFKKGDPVF